ncbi:hypothetical protein QF030_003710 [Streptomyces rishiriensis]|uniref:Uncharacterized protein n=1 Tax=Streptomyces rishiriensis TaxID=68264 RepID=A0ABU0NSK3_STRRH|nr:hypothetical protein [Streptomyces rishiriensis]
MEHVDRRGYDARKGCHYRDGRRRAETATPTAGAVPDCLAP